MAKIMALIGDAGIVANVEWCSDSQLETDAMKDPEGRPVEIGDSYSDGKWYRDGAEILTPLEAALREIENLKAENADMRAALEILEVTPNAEVE